jgi:hypothetical protein
MANPFELRFNVLQMTKDYFDRINEVNVDMARTAFQQALEAGKATAEDWQKFCPQGYSLDQMMEQATKLYSFINKKD